MQIGRRPPGELLKPYWLGALLLLGLILSSAFGEAIGLVLLSAFLTATLAEPQGTGPLSGLQAMAARDPGLFVLILVTVYVTKNLIALCANYASYSLAFRIADDLRLRLVRGYLAAPLRRLSRQQGSMLQMVMDEPSGIAFGFAAGGLFVQNILSAATVYLALLLLSPVLTLGLTGMTIIAVSAVILLSRYAQSIAARKSSVVNEGYAYVTEMLSAIKQLRLFDLQTEVHSRAVKHLTMMRSLQRTSNVIASSPRLLVETIFLAGLGLSFAVLLGRPEGAGLSEVGLVVAAVFRILPSLSASAGTWVQVQQARPALARIGAELALLESVDADAPSGNLPVRFTRNIRVEDVTFTHPGREPALQGITLDIPHGSFIGIVGPSGSGKSTLIDLLCAFYRPDRGRILVDGVDLREIDPVVWRRSLGVVAQDDFLFSGTLRENLLLLRPNATVEMLANVVELVGADFIAELPNGDDTRVGERGVTLSGGQRQRIALARVLLRQPDVLVLDEATSALDIDADMSLQARLDEMRNSMTMIVVAHRLAVVRRADRIVVLSAGRILEQGSHDELIRRNESYAAMWRSSAEATPQAAQGSDQRQPGAVL